MKHLSRFLAFACCAALTIHAQTTTTTVRRFIRATGQGTVSISPDQAKLAVGVVTQAPTAVDASAQNAAQAQRVIDALRNTLGSGAEVKTISYTLTPVYTYPQGQPAILTGYTATNIVEATTNDLSLIGKAIDTAIQSGANRVQSLTFG